MTDRELLAQRLAALHMECPQAVDKLLTFREMLLGKNKVMNLTAVTDPLEVLTRHFLDCAVLAPMIGDGKTVVDVGCGAGFPGIPLAVLTQSQITLLDSLNKRILFLQEVIRDLPLTNAVAVHARAEEFGHREAFDFAVSRAVARLQVLAELCLPMVRIGGQFIAMKAEACEQEVEEACAAITRLGGRLAACKEYTAGGLSRRLVIIEKVSPTPPLYPRRYAQILSKPL